MRQGKTEIKADPAEVDRLLGLVARYRSLERRLDRISASFLGRPYAREPLIGSPETRERLVSRLDAFDCVTYLESVMALALARDAAHFQAVLKALRYDRGKLSWKSRNHYMSQWIERNEERGAVARILCGEWVSERKPRVLSALRAFPPFPQTLSYLPRSHLRLLEGAARTGDLVCFVSERSDLDVFHAGLLVSGTPLRLRHAARSAGKVVEEDLKAFLARNTAPGVMAARLMLEVPGGNA